MSSLDVFAELAHVSERSGAALSRVNAAHAESAGADGLHSRKCHKAVDALCLPFAALIVAPDKERVVERLNELYEEAIQDAQHERT